MRQTTVGGCAGTLGLGLGTLGLGLWAWVFGFGSWDLGLGAYGFGLCFGLNFKLSDLRSQSPKSKAQSPKPKDQPSHLSQIAPRHLSWLFDSEKTEHCRRNVFERTVLSQF